MAVTSWQEEARKARETGKPVEIVGRRDAYSRTFVLPSGTMRTDVSTDRANFKTGAGGWEAIDTSLVADTAPGFAWRTATGPYTAQFPASLADGPVRVSSGGAWVTIRLDGAVGTAQVSGNKVTYVEAYPNVDVTFTATGDSVQKILTLKQAGTRREFPVTMGVSEGVRAEPARGGLRFGKSGVPALVMPRPWATDANGALDGVGGPVTVTAKANPDGTYSGVLAVSEAWLGAPERAFPVLVDPTLHLPDSATLSDCFMVEKGQYADFNYCPTSYFTVGTDDDRGRRRALLAFDTSSIPAESTVLDAEVTLYADALYNTDTDTSYTINAHKVTQPWARGNVSWNHANPATGTLWTNPGGTFSSTVSGSFQTDTRVDKTYTFYAPKLFQDWVQRPGKNEGMLLKQAPTGNVMLIRFASTETGANAPRASVLWIPRLGQQSFDTVLSDSISDRTSVGVNVANGNLLVRTTDVQVAGTGQDLDVDRTYNSLGDKYGTNTEGMGAGALGPGWTSAITGGLWLEPMLKHGSQAFHGPGGMVLPFERVNSSHGTDGWDGPPAMSASLEGTTPPTTRTR